MTAHDRPDPGGTPGIYRLLELAEEHVRLFGDEEIDLEEWLGDDVLSDPVDLAGSLEEIETVLALGKRIRDEIRGRLEMILGEHSAVRVGDVVYVLGPGSSTWKPLRNLWTWLISRDVAEATTIQRIDSIVSSVRVTAVDKIAEEEDLDPDAVRETFLDRKPGRVALQRRDLRVPAVAEYARKWWPEEDGQTTTNPRHGGGTDE